MKVLVVGWGRSSFNSGGSVLFTERYMNVLLKKGIIVHYLFTGKYDLSGKIHYKQYRKNNITYTSLYNAPLTSHDFSDLSDECHNHKIEQIFEKILIRLKPDVVHVTQIFTWPISILRIVNEHRIPLVMTILDFKILCPYTLSYDVHRGKCKLNLLEKCNNCVKDKMKKYDRRLRNLMYRNYISKYVDVLLVPTHVAKTILVRNGFDRNKIQILLEPALSLTVVNPEKHDAVHLGFLAGVFNEEKGFPFLYRTFVKYFADDNRLKLFVYGCQEELLKRFMQYIPSNVLIKPRFNDATIKQVFNEIDAVIIPSTIPDSAPHTLIQAFYCRKPVVISSTISMASLVQNGRNGFIFKNRSKKSLRTCLEKLVKHPDLLQKTIRNAPDIMTFEQYTQKLIAVFKKLINNGCERITEQTINEFTPHKWLNLFKGLTACDLIKFKNILFRNVKKSINKKDKIIVYGLSFLL
ncbi:MAG: glycosyltransferase, partial [Candidatus Hydrogenedentota bacterium]